MQDEHETEGFASVIWDEQPDEAATPLNRAVSSQGGPSHSNPSDPTSSWFLNATASDPSKMLEGTKDAFVSYTISGNTNLPMYASSEFSVKRRFQDFVFLHDGLNKDFPACLAPPLPGKHRMEYLKGDRFGVDFIEKRNADLNRFLHRLTRHPTLARSSLLKDFLQSSEWNAQMHKYKTHTSNVSQDGTLIENVTDTLLNAFTKVRKPDERFVELRESLDKFEDALGSVERIQNRIKGRIGDLANDYEDFGLAIQGLGYLESGITEPLTKFEQLLMEFVSHRHSSGYFIAVDS